MSTDTTQLPASGPLKDLTRLAGKAQTAEAAILAAEESIKTQKADLRRLYEIDIPEVMDELGMKSFTLHDGTILEVAPVVEGSIPVANRPEAFAWLRKHGYDGIIKNEVSVSLGKGQDQLAVAAVETLKKMGLVVDQAESVHAGTLKSWAKELLAKGTNLPLDLLGIYVGRRAKLKDPKKKAPAVD